MFQFSNKLLCHPDKLSAFLSGDYDQTLSTVLLHLSADICNHSCVYCDKYSHEARPQNLSRAFLLQLLNDLQAMHADSIIILGEGAEPLMNQNSSWFINAAVEAGIHCGIYTNGSICTPEILAALNQMDFVRFSLDAGNAATHSKVHRYPRERGDYENALRLIEGIDKSRCEVGAAYIVLPENVSEILETWRLMNSMDVHFLELKLPLIDGYRTVKRDDIQGQRLTSRWPFLFCEHASDSILAAISFCQLSPPLMPPCHARSSSRPYLAVVAGGWQKRTYRRRRESRR